MSSRSVSHDIPDDSGPLLDDMAWSGGFFDEAGRAEWLKVLEHQLRFGSDLIFMCGEPGVGKTTLLRQLATRLDPAQYMIVTCDASRSGAPDVLWECLDRTLKLGEGPEGWDRLKRVARKYAASGQSLVILVDHADGLHEESLNLVASLLEARLAETRVLLILDQGAPPEDPSWDQLAPYLAERSQVLRIRPLSVPESVAYLAFRVRQAQVPESQLDQRQLRQIVTQSEGIPAKLDAGLKASLVKVAGDGLRADPDSRSGGAPKASSRRGTVPPPVAAPAPARKPRKPVTPPKAHTVALGVLAVCLAGFYWVWEKPVPASTISTPSPNAQNLPAPVRQNAITDGVTGAMPPAEAPAGNALSEPVKKDPMALPAPVRKDPMALPPVIKPASPPVAVIPASAPPEEVAASMRLAAPKPAMAAVPEVPAAQSTTAEPTATTQPRPAPREAEKPVTVAPAAVKAPAATPAQPPASGDGLPFAGRQGYTLQLMGLRNEAAAKKMLAQHAGVKGMGYYRTSLGGKPWFVVVQGHYPDARAASSAVLSLPPDLRAGKPFPKRVDAIRQEQR